MIYLYKESFYLWITLKIIFLFFIIYNLFKMFSVSDLNVLEITSICVQLLFIVLASIHVLHSVSDSKTNKTIRIITGIIEIASGMFFIYLINNHATELILLGYIIGLIVILIGLFDLLCIERTNKEDNEEIKNYKRDFIYFDESKSWIFSE